MYVSKNDPMNVSMQSIQKVINILAVLIDRYYSPLMIDDYGPITV